ncbi:hypothetical protein LB566_00010 [Mesorhizobium sp. CA13]|uniref:DUF6949 family protein n=1 Tax=unclassified Mesorhizobium TaxID=325217 RepID=UPI00112786C9|nr:MULTISPECIES: hypothetical protein [unclassified Mesorhizobium]MBZ9852165.1 hypothetical protein [Mesorhizobium sp. CA13]MCA0013535.1 hypothetical protein [Mesorhizobium sp. B294B1A1]MCA0037457.1 hypothetical protein [Mesorhizobium sp. B292B1B]TPM50575.1 hypothetical protein FJ964_02305 [Mesorhizobium sp. B2-3-2]
MGPVELTAFAFLVGLTACGLVGSAMELVAGRKVAFTEPYVSSAHVLRSLAATACAGPFMLLNDALDARREGRISSVALVSCGCTAVAWMLALGIVLVAIACWGAANLGSFGFQA